MIYYSSEARKSHLKNIRKLIVKLGSIPGNVMDSLDVTRIMTYLNDFSRLIEKEEKEQIKSNS